MKNETRLYGPRLSGARLDAERGLIEPRLTGARLSALVQAALVYKVLVYQEWIRSVDPPPQFGQIYDIYLGKRQHISLTNCVTERNKYPSTRDTFRVG